MSPHHTDLQGADLLVDQAQAELACALEALQGKAGARLAETEGVRLALRELVAATRANYPLSRCQRVLAGLGIGFDAKGPTVRIVLERLQAQALMPAPGPRTPLPAGVATPVRHAPVNAIEVDVSDNRPTVELPPKPTIGAWTQDQQPTKPRGRR